MEKPEIRAVVEDKRRGLERVDGEGRHHDTWHNPLHDRDAVDELPALEISVPKREGTLMYGATALAIGVVVASVISAMDAGHRQGEGEAATRIGEMAEAFVANMAEELGLATPEVRHTRESPQESGHQR